MPNIPDFIMMAMNEESMAINASTLPTMHTTSSMLPVLANTPINPTSIPTGPNIESIMGSAHPDTQLEPTLQNMYEHIKVQLRYKRYYSFTITVLETPFAQLPMNAQMETRPCHPSNSRIHALACGHIIAVTRSAEPCAQNCVARVLPDPETRINAPILSQYTPLVSKIRASIEAAVNQYALTFTGTDHHLKDKAMVHVRFLKNFWAQHDRYLAGDVDLLGGNFKCAACKTDGQRESFPTFQMDKEPYHCIVVGRQPFDLRVIEKLEKGALEPLIEYAKYRQCQTRGSHRGRGTSRKGRGGRLAGNSNRSQGHLYHPYETSQTGRGMPSGNRAHYAGVGRSRGSRRGSQVATAMFTE